MALLLWDQSLTPHWEQASPKTQCTVEQIEFHAPGRCPATSGFDDGHVGPDRGGVLLREVEEVSVQRSRRSVGEKWLAFVGATVSERG